jgi:hypothetical protein
MSISDEENKELDNHQEDMYELGAAEEQNEAGSSARILEPISRSPEDEQMEDDVENTNDESVDESAETELLYGELNCENFGDMLGHVQMIFENLHRRKADIDTLLDRLHGYSNVYKIENLVKGFY